MYCILRKSGYFGQTKSKGFTLLESLAIKGGDEINGSIPCRKGEVKASFLTGFSLLEMVIVIIIIGVLASIAFPMYSRYVEDSRVTEATHMLGAIRDAQMRYVTENYGYSKEISNLDLNISQAGRFFDFDLDPSGTTPYPFNEEIEGVAKATRNDNACCGGYDDYEIEIWEDGHFTVNGTSGGTDLPPI